MGGGKSSGVGALNKCIYLRLCSEKSRYTYEHTQQILKVMGLTFWFILFIISSDPPGMDTDF